MDTPWTQSLWSPWTVHMDSMKIKLNKYNKIPWTVHGLNSKFECPYCQKKVLWIGCGIRESEWTPQGLSGGVISPLSFRSNLLWPM